MFEYFRIVGESVQVSKYSFHWQNANGQLHKRWDNATHHPGLAAHPHHVHDGEEENVQPHEPLRGEEVLAVVTDEATAC